MKYCVAVILVIVAVASADVPRNAFARQETGYQQRGFRPAAPSFNLPLRSQRQQLPPTPAASYGPPPQEYGPPAEDTTTTTETPISTTESVEATTFEPQAEQLKQVPDSIYVVVPQSQNLIYAPAPSAKLVAMQQQQRLLPVQAIPAFAKIQEVPQYAQIVQYQSVPVSGYTSFVNTPFSSTFVQTFQ